MAEPITLVECPRDAFQGLPGLIPTQTKVAYLESLIEAGFSHIDFGSFVSPKAVPQMQDTRQVLDAIRHQLKNTSLIAIVPNLQGLEAAIQAGDIRCAGFSLSVSETFQKRNFHQTLEQAWTVVNQLLERSQAVGMDLVVYLSMALGNPYGDPWSVSDVVLHAEKLASKGIRQISLADTIGAATSSSVHTLFSECKKHLSGLDLGIHLHSRPDRWEELVLAAYSAGCRRFDGALMGMGGCPFAKDHLVGNVPTEGLVQCFARMGVETGILYAALEHPLSLAQKILGRYGPQPISQGE